MHAKEQAGIVAALFEGAPAGAPGDDETPEPRAGARSSGGGEETARLETRGPGSTEE